VQSNQGSKTHECRELDGCAAEECRGGRWREGTRNTKASCIESENSSEEDGALPFYHEAQEGRMSLRAAPPALKPPSTSIAGAQHGVVLPPRTPSSVSAPVSRDQALSPPKSPPSQPPGPEIAVSERPVPLRRGGPRRSRDWSYSSSCHDFFDPRFRSASRSWSDNPADMKSLSSGSWLDHSASLNSYPASQPKEKKQYDNPVAKIPAPITKGKGLISK